MWAVTIEVTEPNGTVWTGVVVDPDATLGGPGSVKEEDIVLAQCTNEYGIDDELLNDLYWEWRYSEYYVAGETFNPRKDHDGASEDTPTVYLLPQTGPKAFYRIKAD